MSANGRRGNAFFIERAAPASVLPVSPSPDFASSALRVASASIKISQQRARNAFRSACSDAIALIGDSPSGNGTISGAESFCILAQAFGPTSLSSCFS